MRKRFIKKKESHKALAFLSSMLIIYFYYNPNHALIVLVLLLLGMLLKFIRRTPKLPRCANIKQCINEYHEHPTQFEGYVGELYRKQGFKVHQTKATGDGGRDLIMTKNGIRYNVEVKLYSPSNKIGRPLIQKLHSAAITDKAHPIFVTTSTYTDEARRYAHEIGCELVDGYKLEQLINKYGK